MAAKKKKKRSRKQQAATRKMIAANLRRKSHRGGRINAIGKARWLHGKIPARIQRDTLINLQELDRNASLLAKQGFRKEARKMRKQIAILRKGE